MYILGTDIYRSLGDGIMQKIATNLDHKIDNMRIDDLE